MRKRLDHFGINILRTLFISIGRTEVQSAFDTERSICIVLIEK